MVVELRSDDADDQVSTPERGDTLIESVDALKSQLEDYFEYTQGKVENDRIVEQRDEAIKILQNEIISFKKKNEQLTLANEQLRIQNSHSKDTSDDEVEKLMAQVEKYQAMLEEQAEMVAKYDEVLEKEKVV